MSDDGKPRADDFTVADVLRAEEQLERATVRAVLRTPGIDRWCATNEPRHLVDKLLGQVALENGTIADVIVVLDNGSSLVVHNVADVVPPVTPELTPAEFERRAGELVAMARQIEAQSVMLVRATIRLRDELLKAAIVGTREKEAPKVVHVLLGGVSFCKMRGVPAEWPAGHVWVGWNERDEATCAPCVRECQRRAAAP